MTETMREDGVITPGTSIGGGSGGSLGPLITLKDAQTKTRGALTNWDVFRPAAAAPSGVQRQAAKFGSSATQVDSTKVDVHYFAQKDIETTQYDLCVRLKEERDNLEEAKNETAY